MTFSDRLSLKCARSPGIMSSGTTLKSGQKSRLYQVDSISLPFDLISFLKVPSNSQSIVRSKERRKSRLTISSIMLSMKVCSSSSAQPTKMSPNCQSQRETKSNAFLSYQKTKSFPSLRCAMGSSPFMPTWCTSAAWQRNTCYPVSLGT